MASQVEPEAHGKQHCSRYKQADCQGDLHMYKLMD